MSCRLTYSLLKTEANIITIPRRKSVDTRRASMMTVFSLFQRRISITTVGHLAGCDFGDFDELLTKQFGGYGSDPKKDYEEWLPKKIDAVKRAMAHYEELGGKLEIVVETGRFYVLKYAATRYLAIPKEFVDVERVNNYDDFTVGDISAMLSGGNPVDVEGGGLVLANTESALGLPTTVHMCEVRSKHAEMQKELERVEAEAKEKYELARKEMERKMQELKEKQELQLAEL